MKVTGELPFVVWVGREFIVDGATYLGHATMFNYSRDGKTALRFSTTITRYETLLLRLT